MSGAASGANDPRRKRRAQKRALGGAVALFVVVVVLQRVLNPASFRSALLVMVLASACLTVFFGADWRD